MPGRPAVRLKKENSYNSCSLRFEADKPIPENLRQRRIDEARWAILSAALECFAAFGFEGTSTRAISERAGVTHALVFYHFGSKEKVWIAAMKYALDNYAQKLTDCMATLSDQDAATKLGAVIEKFVHMSTRHPEVHRILATEGDQDSDRLQWVIDHFIRWHFQLVTDLVRQGQCERSVHDFDPARLYYFIIGAAGTPYTIASEYKALTSRDIFSQAEILQNITFIREVVFI